MTIRAVLSSAVTILLLAISGVRGDSSQSARQGLYTWGNATYVNLAQGESCRYAGATIELVSIENNFCTVAVNNRARQLIVARRALPTVLDGVRIFVADNRCVADLTETATNRKVHAALTKDALLCLSDATRPLLDPSHYVFPVSREDGFTWTMHENSHMFAYLRPVRSHEGIDFEVSVANGHYDVQAQIGDAYAPTWQRVIFEGVDAGVYSLDHELAWTPLRRVRIADDRLTVRLQLRDSETCAAIYELHFTRTPEP